MTTNKFLIGEKVVVPAQGIGIIKKIEKHTIMGINSEYYIIFFEDDNLSINIPIDAIEKEGIRRIRGKNKLSEILATLETKPSLMNGFTWNQKSQYLLSKLNSGDLTQIAQVARDLGKNIYKTLSYKENILLGEAISRLSKEISIISNITAKQAEDIVKKNLYNSSI